MSERAGQREETAQPGGWLGRRRLLAIASLIALVGALGAGLFVMVDGHGLTRAAPERAPLAAPLEDLAIVNGARGGALHFQLNGDLRVVLPLRAPVNSRIIGEVNLTASGEMTIVAITLEEDLAFGGAPLPAGFPAFIQQGSCAALVPVPVFPLANARPGRMSMSRVDSPLADLRRGGYAVTVVGPAEDLARLFAPANLRGCADIVAAELAGGLTVTGVTPTGTGPARALVPVASAVASAFSVVALAVVSIGLAGVGWWARRRSRERAFAAPQAHWWG
ncbi:MAG: hypothetical protein H0T49_05760 [Chloroflexia bacterium]|nr:hypothetical protein [Chloroflexia bacterium]